MSQRLLKAAVSVLDTTTRMLAAGALLISQSAWAAPSFPDPSSTIGTFTDFQNYINDGRALGGSAPLQSATLSDDYAVLANFIQRTDSPSDSIKGFVLQVAANGAVETGVRTAPDAYSILRDFVEADGEGSQSGAAPDDAVHAKVTGRPTAALGEAPADSIHSGLKDGAKTDSDEFATLRAFAGQLADGNEPIVVAAANVAPAPAKHAKAPPSKKFEADGASFVGSQACVQCHRNQFGNFGQTLHGQIFLKHPRNAKETEGCEACHGPASLHVKAKEGDNGAAGDIISFRKDSPRPVEERNAICLTCHEKGDRHYWAGGVHETRGLACTNCHEIMEKVSVKNQLIKSTELETCFQCHKDRRAQLARSSHMPLGSGDMTCSSCHNPHGSATDKLLREASVNETCYKCHADKRGPFLWEHEPVRDTCLNCHDPHGTSNEFMLKVQRPRLCTQCHSGGLGHGTPGNPTTVQAINRSCQNCHTKIHGSNSPAGALFQR